MQLSKFTSSNRLFYILIGVIAFVVFITIIWILRGVQAQPPKVTLQFWGVFDTAKDFDAAIKSFQSQNNSVRVQYKEFSYDDYERNLVDAMAAGTGPDILLIHNTWLSKHRNKLSPQPAPTDKNVEGFMNATDFKSQFVDVAYNDLVFSSKIYALPLYVDTLGLYYNKDLLNSAGITRPPTNWEEFSQDVQLLTSLDKAGNIVQAGAAIGTARNINRSTDILMALMMQNGTVMTNTGNTAVTFAKPVNSEQTGQNALQYYVDFANPLKKVYTWNDAEHYSVDAFVEGKVAMMFNYSHEVQVLQSKAPHLNVGIAPMPQVSSLDSKNYPDYWATAVSLGSKNKTAAWQFISYLASRNGAAQYLAQTMRPSARRDIIDLQRTDPNLGVFAIQALSAKSWFQIDDVAIEGIFADMIDDVNYGRAKVLNALRTAEGKVNVLMSKQF